MLDISGNVCNPSVGEGRQQIPGVFGQPILPIRETQARKISDPKINK